MYVTEETYSAVANLVFGYDLACEGGVLLGFREWLIPRVRTGNNLSWDRLVLYLAFPGSKEPAQVATANAANQRHAIDELFRLIDEFDTERSDHDGLRRIFATYERWLRTQSWYEPDHPTWIEWNPSPSRPRRGPVKKRRAAR